MKKHERTRLDQLLQQRTNDSLSEEDTRILIRLSAKRAAELHHQNTPETPAQSPPPGPQRFASHR